jgi:hypothetical protein
VIFLTISWSTKDFVARTEVATLSSKFQISVPKAVRIAKQGHAGQTFAFIPKGEGVLPAPIPQREDLAGLVRGANTRDYRDRTDRT